MKFASLLAATAALMILTPVSAAQATVLVEDTSGTEVSVAGFYFGQSFTLGASSASNITFNFFDANSNPLANGTAYIFTNQYLGTAADLSSATSNLVGASVSSGGVYTFASGLTLSAGTQYFLYADTIMQLLGNGTSYSGGSYSYAFGGNNFTSVPSNDVNFRLSSTSAVPEPATWAMMLIGFGAMGVSMRRRRRTQSLLQVA